MPAVSATLDRQRLLARHLRHPPGRRTALLISIRPEYAKRIASGEKRVEFRRRLPGKLTCGRAFFYVTSPVQRIEMVATIARIVCAAPTTLWRQFASISGTPRAAFDAYFAGAGTGFALILDDVRLLRPAFSLADERLRHAGFRPPQSVAVLPCGSAIEALLNSSAATHRAPDLRA